MFLLGLPLLVAVIVVVVLLAQRNNQGAKPEGVGTHFTQPVEHPSPPHTVTRSLNYDLQRWAAEGLITPQQADAILSHEQRALAAPPPAPGPARRIPAVAEALGYLGGVLGIVGVSVLVSRYWSDIAAAGRIGLAGGATAAFIVAGLMVREQTDPTSKRLRGFLWLLATGAAGLTAGIVAHDLFDADDPVTIATVAAAGVAVVSGVLWRWRDRPLQQLTCLTGVLATVGFGVNQVADYGITGIALWITAVALLAVGVLRLTPEAWITAAVGAIGGLTGGVVASNQWNGHGLLLAVATGLSVIGLAVARQISMTSGERVALSIIGGIGTMNTLPATIVWFADGAGIVTGLVVWCAGAALLTIGILRMVRVPLVVEIVGGLAVVVGAAVTGAQSAAFATVFGLLSAVAMLSVGMLPGRVLMSLFGSLGLLVNVPWAIQHFFPGEGRVPLLIAVSGLLLVLVSVLLTRMSGRFRREVHN